MNTKSLLTLLTSLLVAPVMASALLLPTKGLEAQVTVAQTDAAALLDEADRLRLQGLGQSNISQFREALQTWEQALEIYREIGDRRLEGITLDNMGGAYRRLGEYERALDYLHQSLAIAQETGNSRGEGNVLTGIGAVYRALGQYEHALAHHHQSLEILQEIGDRRLEGIALNNIGGVYRSLSDYEQALDYYEQSRMIAQAVGDRQSEGNMLNNIGAVYDDLAQYESALNYYQQSLPIRREVSDRQGEGDTLNNLGTVYANLGQYQRALDFYNQSLSIRQEVGDRRGEGITLNNLGSVHLRLGQYDQALEHYQRSLGIRREIGDRHGEGSTLSGIGRVYDNLGQYQLAIEAYQQSLIIAQDIGDRRGEGTHLNNIALVYSDLGKYQQALEYHQQSLIIAQDIGDRRGEGTHLNNIALMYTKLGQYQRALEHYQESLSIAQDIGDRVGEGITLSNIGLVYDHREHHQQALEYYQRSVAILQAIGNRIGEGTSLDNVGSMYRALGNDKQALTHYQQSLAIRREIGDRLGEGTTLSNIGFLLAEQNQPELAIVFYKQSVNVRESIRGDIRGLDREQQQSFTDTVAHSYRDLANLLLQADRILEAQEVLDLLKLQELQEYEIQEIRGTAETRQGLDFWAAEQAILDRFYAALQSDDPFDFDTFISSPEVVANVQQLQRNAQGQNLNPAQLVRLQDNLQQAGNAALLYPLILDDRLELVLVTTEGLVRETVTLDRVKLNETIANFRSDVTERFSDPLPNAQQLYQWLISPIADDLTQAGAETILYAADGQLRYIPLAALHDGEQYLTQQFTVNHITAASLTDFSQSGGSSLNVLAGAFPETGMTVNLGTEQVWFNGLPYAQAEVVNLEQAIPNTQALFSDAFNRSALEPQLDQYTILHLATHAEFRSGHPTDSYILLGDGDRITLFDLDKWDLPNTDLVVLSACKTAVSAAALGDGAEILGFGYQIQRTGADAAIASLWYVSDGGTQTLMDSFYTALGNGYAKAEALRRAQIALINSDETVLEGERGVEVEITDLRTGQPLSQSSDLAHPYYWAPFILIGNGL